MTPKETYTVRSGGAKSKIIANGERTIKGRSYKSALAAHLRVPVQELAIKKVQPRICHANDRLTITEPID